MSEEIKTELPIEEEVLVESTKERFFDRFLEKAVTVQFICSFVAIIATISITIILALSDAGIARTVVGDVLGIILLVLYIIGILAAIISCPIKLISTPLRWAVKGFKMGIFIPGIGCLIGAFLGFVIGAAAVIYAPAIITVPNALIS